ncbi:MAG: hypothetical protein LQ343_006691 [Gyalolechia ehrenbergii]|nr:MAG: hypothetical protein LQ343_006691 [Gyalolechia ehrenbergii]
MPSDLQKLVCSLQEKRGIEITPKTKFIQATREECKAMKEDMNLHTLADKITYAGWLYEGDEEGERLIARGRSNQWFDPAMTAQGCPPKPKPDMSWGYRDDAFSEHINNKRKALPHHCQLYSDKPWFVYMVNEWKSSAESPDKAEQQARRDCAAAGDVLYHIFKLAYPDKEPEAHFTCVFSLCVHSKGFDYRVHWRRVAEDGTVSWEADMVSEARFRHPEEVFQTRGAILKTLDWVRGDRLKAITGALKAIPTA